jgi:antitoxin YefM
VATRTLPLSEVRANLSSVVRDADQLFERTIITQKGKPAAVVIGYAEFESWQETLEILGDPALMADLSQADEDLLAGNTHTYEEVFGHSRPETG